MAGNEDETRHSKADAPELVADPQARAEREARNALRQFDEAIQYIEDYLRPPQRAFRLRASTILGLHRAALDGLSAFAGNFRPAGVKTGGSKHQPPDGYLVP